MADRAKPRRKEIEALRAFFDAYRRIDKRRGLDQDKLFAAMAAHVAHRLASPGARVDFEQLCRHGCVPEVLAAIIVLLKSSPGLKRFWAEVIRNHRKRQKATRVLEKAAATLEDVFREFLAIEHKGLGKMFTSVGRIPHSRLISELRFYVRFLSLTEGIGSDMDARSMLEIIKYVLSSYVKQVTGRFHDANVSGLLAEVVGPEDYNEVAHRMWRSRNYRRLDRQLAKLTRVAAGVSVALRPSP